jgi:hypothetical protein
MNFTSNTITVGGLAVGVILLLHELWLWWRGGGGGAGKGGTKKGGPVSAGGGKSRDPKVLIPFAGGIAFGQLCVACPAGLLGTFAGVLRWAGNGVGGTGMSGATGHSPSTIAQGSAPALTDGGALVTTIFLGLLILMWKKLPKQVRAKLTKGVWCGTLLGIGTGLAAVIGAAVIPTANDLGQQLIGVITTGTYV